MRRHRINEAKRYKTLAAAIEAAVAPLHHTENRPIAQAFNYHMDEIIKSPEQRAAERAAEEQRAFDAIAARARRNH